MFGIRRNLTDDVWNKSGRLCLELPASVCVRQEPAQTSPLRRREPPGSTRSTAASWAIRRCTSISRWKSPLAGIARLASGPSGRVAGRSRSSWRSPRSNCRRCVRPRRSSRARPSTAARWRPSRTTRRRSAAWDSTTWTPGERACLPSRCRRCGAATSGSLRSARVPASMRGCSRKSRMARSTTWRRPARRRGRPVAPRPHSREVPGRHRAIR